MPDIGWSELLVIGVVALIVVGPKDLPILFRRMGQFTGRARAMAREFTSAMNAAADETGLKDVSRDLRKISDPRKMGLDALKGAAADLDNWDDAPMPPAASTQTTPASVPPKTMGPATDDKPA
ncbi:MAG: Sec-independent protein translocase protein TatB [Qingshengfaniella sp.]